MVCGCERERKLCFKDKTMFFLAAFVSFSANVLLAIHALSAY
jgi:hypothetical protein